MTATASIIVARIITAFAITFYAGTTLANPTDLDKELSEAARAHSHTIAALGIAYRKTLDADMAATAAEAEFKVAATAERRAGLTYQLAAQAVFDQTEPTARRQAGDAEAQRMADGIRSLYLHIARGSADADDILKRILGILARAPVEAKDVKDNAP